MHTMLQEHGLTNHKFIIISSGGIQSWRVVPVQPGSDKQEDKHIN